MKTGMVISTEQKSWRENKKKRRRQEQKKMDYHPSQPEYDHIQEEEAMPKFTPKIKLPLDPSDYLPNYVPCQKEDSTPSLMNNLVPYQIN